LIFCHEESMDKQDKAALAAIGAATGLSTAAGTITILVTTTKILGITVASTTVGLPVAGLVLAGGALTWGGYKVWKVMQAAGNEGKDDMLPISGPLPVPHDGKPPQLSDGGAVGEQ
jgi:hypothetical protein